MRSPRSRPRLSLALVLALVVALTSAATAGVAEAKKGKKGKTFDSALAGGPIPDADPAGNFGFAEFTADAGKKFKGKKIRDVNLTLQVGGGPGANPLVDIGATLSAPDGTSTTLFYPFAFTGQLAGPLTFDDNTFVDVFGGLPPGDGDTTTLLAPYQGSAQPEGKALTGMNNGKVRGTWTLRLFDVAVGDTSIVTGWRIQVKAGKPYKTKRGKG